MWGSGPSPPQYRGGMCYAYDALPPELPDDVRVSATHQRDVELTTLTSRDGTELVAAFAEAADPAGPPVVILPDVRGLFRFYWELAQRFAQAGHHAIAIDYFGRTAGAEVRGEEFDFMPHIRQTSPEKIQADIAAAIAFVTERTGQADCATLGFCFGGSQSFLATCNSDLGLSGAVGFYGGLDGSRLGVFPSPVDLTESMHGSILGLFGGSDPSIPPELVERFDAGLGEAGIPHEVVVYEGAPHSFFDRSYADHADECDDAWRRVLGFLSTLGNQVA